MATNLTGYSGNGAGNTELVAYILDHPKALDLTKSVEEIAKDLFHNHFLPVANQKWKYHGGTCNCQDLAGAFAGLWEYLKFRESKKKPEQNPRLNLPRCEVVECGDRTRGIITNGALSVLGGIANGNIRAQTSGMLDGRCLFPSHTLCKIDTKFYDPTFMQITSTVNACVQRELGGRLFPNSLMWVTSGAPKKVYINDDNTPTSGFSNCYREVANAEGWISHQNWITKTSRGGLHTRSLDLHAVDGALKLLETHGWPGYQKLVPAVKKWLQSNPTEAKTRNVDNCVKNLAWFAGITWHP